MQLAYVLAGASCTLSVVTASLRRRGLEKYRLVSKTLASLLFCATGLVSAALRERMNTAAALMLGALVLGLIGDIFLGLDQLVHEEIRPYFLILGGVPFFLGHIIYIILLLPIGDFSPFVLLALPVVPLLFLILRKTKVMDFGRETFILMGYGVFLGTMMMSTLNIARQGADLTQGEAFAHLMLLPGILFAISDTTLFLNRFGSEKIQRWKPAFFYIIMLTYYPAQVMFALAVRYI